MPTENHSHIASFIWSICNLLRGPYKRNEYRKPDEANMQMGYVFEELIRIGAEQSNEEAGEHFTPREVIKLMVNLLLSPEKDLARSHVIKTIYDPACGTGGIPHRPHHRRRHLQD